MDNNKKEKLVAILLTTLVSLAVSAVACILGVSPDTLTKGITNAEPAALVSVVDYTD